MPVLSTHAFSTPTSIEVAQLTSLLTISAVLPALSSVKELIQEKIIAARAIVKPIKRTVAINGDIPLLLLFFINIHQQTTLLLGLALFFYLRIQILLL